MKSRLLSLPCVKAFTLALSLLTRLPTPNLPDLQPEDSGRSALFYPLTGLIIGLFLWLPVLLFPNASPLLLAAVITVVWAAITGGLHLDGLADSADGWLGGMGNRQKTLLIMKDPVVGMGGVTAIVCVLLLKFSALTALLSQGFFQGSLQSNAIIILLAPLLGRSVIILLFLTTPLAKRNAPTESMASSVIEYMPKKIAMVVIGTSSLFSIIFSLWGMLFALAGFFLLRRLMLKRLGGCTGDTAGATVELTEMLWLLGAALTL